MDKNEDASDQDRRIRAHIRAMLLKLKAAKEASISGRNGAETDRKQESAGLIDRDQTPTAPV
jgi:hypothetical protein